MILMCEANVYLISDGTEEQVMREVLLLEAEGESIRLTDISGKKRKLEGHIRSVDFLEHKVVVQA